MAGQCCQVCACEANEFSMAHIALKEHSGNPRLKLCSLFSRFGVGLHSCCGVQTGVSFFLSSCKRVSTERLSNRSCCILPTGPSCRGRFGNTLWSCFNMLLTQLTSLEKNLCWLSAVFPLSNGLVFGHLESIDICTVNVAVNLPTRRTFWQEVPWAWWADQPAGGVVV